MGDLTLFRSSRVKNWYVDLASFGMPKFFFGIFLVLLRAESFVFSCAFLVGFFGRSTDPVGLDGHGHRMDGNEIKGIFFGSALAFGLRFGVPTIAARMENELLRSLGRLVLETRAEGACDPCWMGYA